jgi:predicted metal-binding protein
MTLINWVSIALILSIMVNIFAIWYIRKLLAKVLFVSQNLTDLVDLLVTYRNHLRKIYSMEMFHGDETINFLIQHTNSLLDVLEDYSDIYLMTEPMELAELEDEESYEETTRTETFNTEKDVFYGGSRSGNS